VLLAHSAPPKPALLPRAQLTVRPRSILRPIPNFRILPCQAAMVAIVDVGLSVLWETQTLYPPLFPTVTVALGAN